LVKSRPLTAGFAADPAIGDEFGLTERIITLSGCGPAPSIHTAQVWFHHDDGERQRLGSEMWSRAAGWDCSWRRKARRFWHFSIRAFEVSMMLRLTLGAH
jgi:hypothetical protein